MAIEERRSTTLVLAVSAVAAIAGGCGSDAVTSRGFAVDTVGGVVRVANTGAGAWPDGAGWRVGPMLQIGADPMAEDAYAFGSITGLTVADDGTIYVADGQAFEIRAFSPAGEFLFRFGRSGEGPGEFGAIDALAMTPDGSIMARDPRQFRVTRFDASGAYQTQFRINRPFQQYAGGFGFAIDRDGIVHDRLSTSLGIESDDSLAIIRYEADGTPRDTLFVGATPRRLANVLEDGLPQMGLSIPFSAFTSAVVGPDGTIARTSGSRYSFDLLDSDGSVRRTITRDVEPETVSASERDSALTAMRENAQRYTDGGQLEDFEFPTTKPAITHLYADADGNWWVGSSSAASRLTAPDSFDVFDPDGRFLGTVAVPFRPFEIGSDYIAGVAVDELGVESVVVAPLIKGG